MKKIIVIILMLSGSLCFGFVIKDQRKLDGLNISTWIWNTGVFNQDLRATNTAGLEWPKGTGKFACFTAGLSIGAYINGELRLGNASYNGEYAPGYVFDSAGIPIFKTNDSFKIYSIKNTDTYLSSADYRNWKLMVPYGAPYTDINNNGMFDEQIDIPGVDGAMQTVFVCLTDADSSNHTSSEGLSGGTPPVFAEVHFTSWTYDLQGLGDVIFHKWIVVNKNKYNWEKTKIGVFEDCAIGDENDDYIGYDSSLKLGYCYNYSNLDGDGYGRSYGWNPPASGFTFLQSPIDNVTRDTLEMSFTPAYKNMFLCTLDPSSPQTGYNYMSGKQRNGMAWYNPLENPLRATKKTYTGNPVDSTGWTERNGTYIGCGTSPYPDSTLISPLPPNDRRYYMFNISDNFTVRPGEKQKLIGCQLVARGNSNLNSIDKLRELKAKVDVFYNLAIKNNSDENTNIADPNKLPASYKLFQNYPNPFNPVTTIRYEMKKLWQVKIQIYDMKGELISTLVNEPKPQGNYEIKFDASSLPSGIYFIKMVSGGGFEDSKKMVVIK